jgi:AcrR family transcriptional regulator
MEIVARPRRQEARRRELVDAAADLLVAEGAAGARLTDIARAAGITPASVSYYYPDIYELYAAAFDVASRQFVLLRRRAVARKDTPAEKLAECIRLGIPKRGTKSHVAGILLGELASLANRRVEMRDSARRFEDEQIALFAEILDGGVAGGDFTLRHPTSDAARLLLASEDGLAFSVIAGRLSAGDALRLLLHHASTMVGYDLDVASGVPKIPTEAVVVQPPPPTGPPETDIR